MSNISLIGKTVSKVEYIYKGLDNIYKITFSDGTILEWGYEQGEGHTILDGEDMTNLGMISNG